MNRQKAINLYFSRNPRSEKILKRLMRWDSTKTSKENGDVLFGYLTIPQRKVNAMNFARRFGLTWVSRNKCVKMHQRPRNYIRYYIMSKMRHEFHLTHESIAKAFGISKQAVHQILSEYSNRKFAKKVER